MSDNRWSANRRTFVKTAGAAGAVALAGCNGGTSGETDGTPTAQFILNPAEADVEITQQYQPMFEYLESEVEVEIEADRAESYTATLQSMRNDQGEIADISPSAVIAGEDILDIVGVRVAYGAARYFSTITTTPDSGIESLSDLEGELVYMGDILSVSGTLVPLTILQDAGLDVGNAPNGDPGNFEAEFSDHTTAREQMVQRDDVMAATTGAFSSAPYVPQEQFEEMSQDFVDISAEYEGAGDEIESSGTELQLLAVSDPIPRAPLATRSNWDSPVKAELEEAILNVSEDDLSHGDDYDGEPLWFTGVQEGSIDDYQPIQRVLDQLGLEFEDLS
ncbi:MULTISPECIES: PhnD/SsuA/transferrin family substrate-binding protein [Halorubrum]|uniref:Phosphate/phosphonate ABC transporter substrate-binding protein n=1 Tax=Halorubrum hochstenium ATCC 700873 TaxID=1227481 RepID=M0FJ26_9EURY|nr:MULTISPECIES: PhnD/SsuA/transferrin family substrate-binding protein [Halorubrum]ELZ58579.1 phosphate/phosphonate ABC transporter substrate-binding protein [Halorubrum hochstenium ATCC 700873]